MSAQDVETRAERVRMALAEAGYPHAVIETTDRGSIRFNRSTVPDDVLWKAAALAGPGLEQSCLACFVALPCAHEQAMRTERCLSLGTGVLDCGVDRSDW